MDLNKSFCYVSHQFLFSAAVLRDFPCSCKLVFSPAYRGKHVKKFTANGDQRLPSHLVLCAGSLRFSLLLLVGFFAVAKSWLCLLW